MLLATSSDMKEMDRKTMQTISSAQLMKQAAQSVYHVISERIEKSSRILIVCGNGNNGGDGYALADLAKEEYQIEILAERKPNTEDAQFYYHQALHNQIPIHHDLPNLNTYDVIIDAIFGTGLHRDMKEPFKSWISLLNASNKYIIAIDMPSGVDSDDGSIYQVAIQANVVISLQYAKRGMYFYPGYEQCKEIIITDIGIPKEYQRITEPIQVLEDDLIKSLLPKRKAHSHKGTYGKVLMIGGSTSMHGAITMAADALLHSGIGTLTVMVPETIREFVSMKLYEAMILSAPSEHGYFASGAIDILKEHISKYDMIMIGCGLGRHDVGEELVKTVLLSDRPCVLDADALYSLAKFPEYLKRKQPIVLTPHLKEFSYISKASMQEIQTNPLKEAKSFLQAYPNVTLVLKDERTLILHQQQIYLNIKGNNALAKGGSGDVLCGLITGMFAQSENALDAACCGVYLHAKCADFLAINHSLYTILPHDLYTVLDSVFLSLET